VTDLSYANKVIAALQQEAGAFSKTTTAYICVSPLGNPIPSTIRPSTDESWRVLRESVTEPDTLIDAGWTVCRVYCVVGEQIV
jgi:hypothetical protein